MHFSGMLTFSIKQIYVGPEYREIELQYPQPCMWQVYKICTSKFPLGDPHRDETQNVACDVRNWDKVQAECRSVKATWGNGPLRTHPEIHKHLKRML
jgi:hypothetical protein